MYKPTKIALKRMIQVASITSEREDHDTFFNSITTSEKNFLTLPIILYPYRPGRVRTYNTRFWRPMLCQLELQAYCMPVLLFHFFVCRMQTTETTILFKLYSIRFFLFIFCTRIVNTFTFSTLKIYIFSHRYSLKKIDKNFYYLSPRPDLNRRPRPYQGRALPSELQGHIYCLK